MSIETARAFFDKSGQIAVIGVSQNSKKFGYTVFEKLKKNGYNIVGVNPIANEF
jgi:predicted CoA-binding protein